MGRGRKADVGVLALMNEEWRQIPDIPNYEASSLGRLRHSRFKRIRATHVAPHGYLSVRLSRPGKPEGSNYLVHRLICAAFHGRAVSPNYEVRHLDGNRLNNIPSNLCWGTSVENRHDTERHGRAATCGRHGSAKLSEDEVRQILRLRSTMTLKALAHRFGVCIATVGHITSGRNWKCLSKHSRMSR